MRFAVLVSGSGTNLQAMLDAAARGALTPARLALVVSNVPGVLALDRAAAAGLPTRCLDHRGFASRTAFEEALLATLRDHQIEAVALAGFMRLLGPPLLDAFPGRVINIHPSLLPAFPGLHAQRQALAHGVKIAGCTVHFVDPGTDSGPIIAQAAVPVLDDDDEATLGARILGEEHRLYPQVMRWLAEERLERRGRQVTLRPDRPPAG